ncbi:MAG: glycerol-3-phosphate 1-O-acyltransferase PlsY [Alphaproteobacteria bacterium]|nr:glycerol-3-phosphate 1-O-acyltransferase PlsY [Alphaproteobacteria bacterium]
MFDFVHPINWTVAGPHYALAALFGYLLGSIPFGLIFVRLTGGGDVRQIGSGNIGATNVLRTGKKGIAAATFLCDAGKGAAAVLVLRALYGNDMAVFGALGAVLGHLFPVWLGFRGGKGVSTFFGVTFALCWPVGLMAGATWLAVAFLLRISSLAALVTTALAPFYMILVDQHLYATLMLVLAGVIWVMHRANIARLIKGAEPRIGAKKA